MEGWILKKKKEEEIEPDSYEALRFMEVAKKRDVKIRILNPEQFDLIVTREDKKSIVLDNQSTQLPQFLLPRQGANTPYFSLAIIRHLERLGVPTFNSSHSIEAVKDKLYTQQILAASNLPVPKTMLARYPLNIDLIEKVITFPAVVKTISGTQGTGVFLCETKSHLEDLMQLMDTAKTNTNFIIQEFIHNSRGRDLRVFVVGGRVIACMERISKDGSFKANFSRGGGVKEYDYLQDKRDPSLLFIET